MAFRIRVPAQPRIQCNLDALSLELPIAGVALQGLLVDQKHSFQITSHPIPLVYEPGIPFPCRGIGRPDLEVLFECLFGFFQTILSLIAASNVEHGRSVSLDLEVVQEICAHTEHGHRSEQHHQENQVESSHCSEPESMRMHGGETPPHGLVRSRPKSL